MFEKGSRIGMSAKGNERRDFPKNIRQIGEANKEKRIYLEDYAVAYLRQVKGAVLLGETVKIRGNRCYFVSGAVEVPEGDFTEENWAYVTEEAERSFGELSVVGWFLRAEEIPEELDEEDMHVYKEHFPGREAILVVYNELEKEEAVYLTLDGFLRRQNGYYIYYERNPQMQEYLIAKNEGRSVEKEAVVSDQAIRSFRRIIEEKRLAKGERSSQEEAADHSIRQEQKIAANEETKTVQKTKAVQKAKAAAVEDGDGPIDKKAGHSADEEAILESKADGESEKENVKQELRTGSFRLSIGKTLRSAVFSSDQSEKTASGEEEDQEPPKEEHSQQEEAEEAAILDTPKISGIRLVREKKKQTSPKVKTLHFLYTASTFLVLIILIIGVTMINNYDKMKEMEQAMAQMTEGAMVSANINGQGTEAQTSQTRTTVIDVRSGETEILGGILEESESGAAESGVADASAPGISDIPGQNGISNQGDSNVLNNSSQQYGGSDGSMENSAGMQTGGNIDNSAGIQTGGNMENSAGIQTGSNIDNSAGMQTGGNMENGTGIQTGSNMENGTDIQTGGNAGVQDSAQTGASAPNSINDQNGGSLQSNTTGNTDLPSSGNDLAANDTASGGTDLSNTGSANNSYDASQTANAPVHASQTTYTVKFGDTLADICTRYYGSTEKLQEICDLNSITNPNAILPGQKLVLP